MEKNCFYIAKTKDAKDLPFPRYMSEGAAGMDLYAKIDSPLTLPAGKIILVPTGVKIALPQGYEAQIRPRSGLALNHGISLVNTPGTIDSDYRGELKIIMINFGSEDYTINRGDRIAQMIINKIENITFTIVDELPQDTKRGTEGFGHSGK